MGAVSAMFAGGVRSGTDCKYLLGLSLSSPLPDFRMPSCRSGIRAAMWCAAREAREVSAFGEATVSVFVVALLRAVVWYTRNAVAWLVEVSSSVGLLD